MWHNLAVAVKIVLFSTASVNRRIALQEAALSKSISHPNIIATYAVDAKPMSVLGRVLNQPQANGGSLAPGGQPSKSLADIQVRRRRRRRREHVWAPARSRSRSRPSTAPHHLPVWNASIIRLHPPSYA